VLVCHEDITRLPGPAYQFRQGRLCAAVHIAHGLDPNARAIRVRAIERSIECDGLVYETGCLGE